ncbi:MAG: hypothetical protein JSR85_08605 [Proteobacteria bacterium]|nr:hypothetical protein [Pseudomonadota bacterium]
MVSLPESEKPDEKIIPDSSSGDSTKRLDLHVRKMPELSEQARVIDQVLVNRLQDLKSTASAIIDQFNEQKKLILQRFDACILPIAQEVLEGFIRDAEHLKYKLDGKLENFDQTPSSEWDEQAKHWTRLYNQWNDRKGLVDKILEVVADRTKYLIDKDIQVVQDYQTQSLSLLPPESEAFKNVEERLTHAIEEPLKQLMNLRNQAKEQTSLQQASEWVAKLQERREVYFDQLLMKIDHVMKDVVNVDDTKDWTAFVETEGEILFMERELHHINSDLTHLHLIDESDKQFLLGRLEGLLDHVEDFHKNPLPHALKEKIHSLKSGILLAISRLQ